MSLFTSLISNSIYGAIKNWMMMKKQRDIIIDPMSCLIKLSILGYMPIGTKMSIANNKILFNQPSLLQGTIRFFQADNREDLHNLFNPIQKSIQWYWNKEDSNTLYIFDLAINGLKTLKKSYPSNSTIQYTLDYYINLLNKKNLEDYTTAEEDESSKNSIYDFLKILWNQREINIIIELLREYNCKSDKDVSEAETIVLAINTMTDIKDSKLSHFLEHHTSIL